MHHLLGTIPFGEAAFALARGERTEFSGVPRAENVDVCAVDVKCVKTSMVLVAGAIS